MYRPENIPLTVDKAQDFVGLQLLTRGPFIWQGGVGAVSLCANQLTIQFSWLCEMEGGLWKYINKRSLALTVGAMTLEPDGSVRIHAGGIITTVLPKSSNLNIKVR